MPTKPTENISRGDIDHRDGRVRRGARNREKILDAVYDIVRSGESLPTAELVAQRAGVGERTVFRHFEDMEQLHIDMSKRVGDEVIPLVVKPIAAGGSIADRLHELVARRVKIYEHLAPFRRAARPARASSPIIREGHAQLDVAMRRSLRKALSPELVGLTADSVEALDAILSFETWDRLRSNQRLGPIQSARVIEKTALVLLQP